jgi:hypothetical protein
VINLVKKNRNNIRDEFFYLFMQVKIVLLFLYIYFWDVLLIFKNLWNNTKKYNLSSLSILYNILLKYPAIGFRPSSYFMYKLYQNSYKNYLTFFQGISQVIKKNRKMTYFLDDKLKFNIHLQNKIKVPKLIASYNCKNKKIIRYNKPQSSKLVVKPIKGMGGKDINIINSENLNQYLKNCKKSCIAEEFIKQHPKLNMIFSGSVNTIRILTLKKNTKITVIDAILRLGRKNTKHLDNISQGGISVKIEMSSGKMGKGYTFYEYGHNEYTHHPDSGVKFLNKEIPFFKQIKELSITAHKYFPMFTLIGWDIAITHQGPIIIEGNRIPDLSLHQIHKPLKNQIFNITNNY